MKEQWQIEGAVSLNNQEEELNDPLYLKNISKEKVTYTMQNPNVKGITLAENK